MDDTLTRVSVGELNRKTGPVLDRVLRGERFIVCRHRRPIAALQPLGFEVGGAESELARLSDAQRASKKRGDGAMVTGRGYVLREALLAGAGRDDRLFGGPGPSSWEDELEIARER